MTKIDIHKKNNILDKIVGDSIDDFLILQNTVDKFRINKETDIGSNHTFHIIKGRNGIRFYDETPSESFKFKIFKNEEEVGALSFAYNSNTNRFNLCHRLIKADCPIRGKDLFQLAENFISGIKSKYLNLKGLEVYARQKQVINRATEKLGFEVEYENSNELGKIYINNPNDARLKTMDIYIISPNSEAVKGCIVSKDFDEKNNVIQSFDNIADIYLTKNL